MNARRNSRQQSPYDFFYAAVIFVLLLIIGGETFLLWRAYQKKPGERPLIVRRRPAVVMPSSRVPTPIPSAITPSVAPKVKRGKIAIIIDDNGNSPTECTQIEGLSIPLAISVLPSWKYSRQTAICAHRVNKDVMLHLPLEPYENTEKYPDDYIIKTTMPPRVVVRKFRRALASVPFASGMNNHMGSKAMEDMGLMVVLFPEIKAKKMFFVDSKVTNRSVGVTAAKRYHVPFSARDVFLDNESDRAYIEGQFRELAALARKRGHAVGICHARPLTWQILKEQALTLTQQGFEFVSIKDLLRTP